MPSSEARATPQVLNGPGDVYKPTSGPSVTRYPLVYTPDSATQLNFSRLPSPAELQGMDLAYREQLLPDAEVRMLARQRGAVLLIGSVVASLIITLIGAAPADSIIYLLYGASGVIFLGILVAAVRTTAGGPSVSALLIAPLLIVFVGFVLGQVTRYRLYGTALFALLTAASFTVLGTRPFSFYQSWLLTHPRLRPTTRLQFEQRTFVIDELFLAVVLIATVLGPSISTTATMIGIAAASLYRIGGVLKFGSRHALFDVFGQFITYGQLSSGAPGVWHPPDARAKRLWVTFALVAPLYLALTTGLHMFYPADLVGYSALRKVPPTYEERRGVFNDHPLGWVDHALDGGALFDPLTVYLLPVALGTAFLLPTLVLAAVFRPALSSAEELRETIEGTTDTSGAVSGGLDDDGRSEWQWYVDRVRTSPHNATDPLDPVGDPVREAEHLFLGVEPNFKFPVLLDRRVLSEHTYIVGETGSGKTSLGIMPLVLQLLHGCDPRDRPPPSEDAKPERESPPMVVIDLKGDPALFHTLKQTCSDRRIPFRFFTPQPGRASHYFNAFRELRSDARSTMQLAQLILDSLALSHGEGYGRSYYSRQSRRALLKVLTEHPGVGSFQQLYRLLEALKRDKKDAFELISTIHALTLYPQLVTDPKRDYPNDTVIHMPRVLEDREVVYFWLPAALESASVREIGKLALYALLTAAIDRQHAGKETRQAYLVIDEFQRLAGENFKIILEQARSFGVAAILANQTQSDLATPDADLRPTVRTNTRLKMHFSVTDPAEVRTLVESSGEEIAILKSWSMGGEESNGSSTESETLKPRLTRNDVIRASDHPLHFIAHVSRGSGYTQFGGMPIPVRTTWPFTRDVYKTRSSESWPSPSPDLAQGAQKISDIEKAREHEATAAELAAQRARLKRVLDAKAEKAKPS